MTFDEAEQFIKDGHQTHDVFDELRDTYAKPVEMTEMQCDFIRDHIDMGDNIEDGMHFWKTNGLFFGVVPEDMMRAWLNPELIVVVE